MIPSPISDHTTVYDDWLADQRRSHPLLEEPSADLMGTGSDYTVFYHHLGIPSVDLLFNRQGKGVYPYHSNYDSYTWVDKFGDPGFKKHLAMSRLWGVVAARLAGREEVCFAAREYPKVLREQTVILEAEFGTQLHLADLQAAIRSFETTTEALDGRAATLNRDDQETEKLNAAYITLERNFLLEKGHGLPGRPWYRHLVSLLAVQFQVQRYQCPKS